MSTSARSRGSLEVTAEKVRSLAEAREYALSAYRKFMGDDEAALPWAVVYKGHESVKFNADGAASEVAAFDVTIEIAWEVD